MLYRFCNSSGSRGSGFTEKSVCRDSGTGRHGSWPESFVFHLLIDKNSLTLGTLEHFRHSYLRTSVSRPVKFSDTC
jgi:hypothetical protein